MIITIGDLYYKTNDSDEAKNDGWTKYTSNTPITLKKEGDWVKFGNNSDSNTFKFNRPESTMELDGSPIFNVNERTC